MMPALAIAAIVAGGAPSSVDFATEVVPVMSKAGCNAGACHGSAAGRGGFKLSLFGADPAADHAALVHELEGRRVNFAKPADSLVLLKPTGMIRHGGGERLEIDGPGARRILDWVSAGAVLRSTPRRLTAFTITRTSPAKDRHALRVTARFDDGPDEDVTRWTIFTSSDPSAVEVDEMGMATIRRPGQHVVIARFLDRVEAVQLTLEFPGAVPASTTTPPVTGPAHTKVAWRKGLTMTSLREYAVFAPVRRHKSLQTMT